MISSLKETCIVLTGDWTINSTKELKKAFVLQSCDLHRVREYHSTCSLSRSGRKSWMILATNENINYYTHILFRLVEGEGGVDQQRFLEN